jgi:predicted DNA-binding protein YlxM (UPF0122 family)
MRTDKRSDSYQYRFLEMSFDPHIIDNNFVFNEGVTERTKIIQDKLLEKLKELALEHLTDYQYKILYKRYFEHKTQQEIADEMDINQSSVNKCLNGGYYIKGSYVKYGGLIKKLKLICLENKEIKGLLDLLNYEDGENADPEWLEQEM